MSSKSDRLHSEIMSEINDAWYGVDFSKQELIKPLDILSGTEDDPTEYHKRLTYLITNTDYIHFVCKVILNIDLLPMQVMMLQQIWKHKFPMLIATRGYGKTFCLSLYALLRAFLIPGRKVVVVGAAFRQSKFLHEYMETIWKGSPIIRDMCDSNSGPKRDIDMCRMHIGESVITSLPIGDGSKIRGQRANDIIADEFGSQSREIFETVIAGFAAVSATPSDNVRYEAADKKAKELGVSLEEMNINLEKKNDGNQIVLSGTAFYDFNHFAEYWKRWCQIIRSKGDNNKLQSIFNGPVPEDFDWRDYCVIRIPYEKIPKGFMDDTQISRARATVHAGIFEMEYGACATPSTPIITDVGVKKIVDVQVGDRVLTHKGRFRKVTKRTYREYEGEIFDIDTYGCHENNSFTTDHPFFNGKEFDYVSEDWEHLYLSNLQELSGLRSIEVKNHTKDYIDRNDYIYPRSGKNKWTYEEFQDILERLESGETQSSIARYYNTIPSRIHSIDHQKKPKNAIDQVINLDYSLGLCFGYYASEGSGGADGRMISFALDGHVGIGLEKYVEELDGAFRNSFGLCLTRKSSKSDNVMELYCCSRIVYDLFKSICPGVCYDKIMDHDILFSNREFLTGYIVGMWNGDGHIRENVACLQLTNLSLVNQVKIALSFFGISCRIRKPKIEDAIFRGKTYKCSQAYWISISSCNFEKFMQTFYNKNFTINTQRNKTKVFNEDRGTKCKIKDLNRQEYSGLVYNLEVEEDNSYSTLNATVHNCFSKDSQGFFKRTLIESCVGTDMHPVELNSGPVCYDPMLRGNPSLEYVVGIDPASEIDNFSVVVLELHPDHQRIVYCWTTTRSEHKERLKLGLTEEHDFYSYGVRKVRDLMKLFNIVHISLDAQGGGIGVIEAFQDPDKIQPGEVKIWPTIEEDKEKDTDLMDGLHIVEMCQFARSDWLSEANHGLRKDFEDKALLFPRFDPITIGLSLEQDKIYGRLYDTLEDCVMDIEELKNELSIIVISQTPNGRDKWDTPEVKVGVGKKERLRKDRYSALLMANMAARQRSRVLATHRYCDTVGGFAVVSDSKEKGKIEFSGPSWYTENCQGLFDSY